jgi:Arc/MetJ-type ribon-helix-helix transcriptional regulator
METKRRLSASVDAGLVAAAEASVARGEFSSVSSWVSAAMAAQIEHQTRLLAMDQFLEAFEAEFGEITDAEIVAATRKARASATVVRSPELPATPGHSKRRPA